MIKHAIFSLAALALAAGTLAAPAHAEDGTATVRIGDLDLATKSGNARLQRRLQGAATEICGEVRTMPLDVRAMTQACHKEVMESSREQVALATARDQSNVRLARRDR